MSIELEVKGPGAAAPVNEAPVDGNAGLPTSAVDLALELKLVDDSAEQAELAKRTTAAIAAALWTCTDPFTCPVAR